MSRYLGQEEGVNDLTNMTSFCRDRFQCVSSRLMATGGCGNRFVKKGCGHSVHNRSGYDKRGYTRIN